MKVVIYGNFSVSYCSEVHHAQALERLGCEVVRLQETEVRTEGVLRACLNADLFVWIHSHGFKNPGSLTMEYVLESLKELHVPTMAYHLDLYMGIARWDEYQFSSYLRALDYFFTVDRKMADWLNEVAGKTKGIYLRAGISQEHCYRGTANKDLDVVFVGSRGYHPEWPYRPQLIDWLRRTYGRRFTHVGGDGIGVVRGDELNRLYDRCKVVVGDTLCPGFDYPDYWSDRVYETVGRGAFLIHPEIKGLRSEFGPDELMTYPYGDFDRLKELIDSALDQPEARELFIKKGFTKVKENYTYTHRWSTILKTIFPEHTTLWLSK